MRKNERKIVCLNTNEIFDSSKDASEKYNIDKFNILRCCNNKRKSAGRINNEKAVWVYYEDYLLLKNDDIQQIISKSKKNTVKYEKRHIKRIICLNTNEVFDSPKEASEKYQINIRCIYNCCGGYKKSAGKINGEKAIWMYYEDYLLLENNDIQNILNENNTIKNNRRVICLNTNEVFDSINQAEKEYGINANNIYYCCGGYKKSAGKINGKKAIWMYYEDYLLLKEDDVEHIINKNNRRVVCLNTKEVFDSINQAEKEYGINANNIYYCCGGYKKSAGKINGKKAIWMYYEDYLLLKENDIEHIINKNNTTTNKKVICLNTNKVFDSVEEAGKEYKISVGGIYHCCGGKRKSSGKINGEKASWMYYEDYLNLSKIK